MKSIKRALATIVMLVMVFTLMLGTFSVSAAAAVECSQSLVLVDDDFAGIANNTKVSAAVNGITYNGVMGKTAFATVVEAAAAVADRGDVYVAAGVYSGDIELAKTINFYGNKAGISPNRTDDITIKSADRDATGVNESILQDTVFYYAALAIGEQSGLCSLTVNGFALAGDSAIYLQGTRTNGAKLDISYNVFDLVNERAYARVGVETDTFDAICAGLATNYQNPIAAATIAYNRIEKVGSTGTGLTMTGGIRTSWVQKLNVNNNYVANVTGDLLACSEHTTQTYVTDNYFTKGEKVRVYDGIRGDIDISGNTFDGIGGTSAGGTYALGVYADATSNNYNNTWYESANSVLIYSNTFLNVGKAIRLYGRTRSGDTVLNYAPLGTQIYDNVFTPVKTDDCCFLSYAFSDGSYSPKVYNNYTAGLNPKDITVIENSDSASVEYGSYWLDARMTDSSDLLAVKAVTNENGVSFADATVQIAPDCTVNAVVPEAISAIKLGLEVGDGAYYELFADAECTTALENDTLSLHTGTNYAYAKVHCREYSIVYTIALTQKKFYSTFLNSNESVVGPEFAQYAIGQQIYVEIGGDWYRAVVGLSAFSDLGTAIANASIGDIIYMTAGLYDSSFTFNKGVILRGAKYGIDPNDRENYEIVDDRKDQAHETVFSKELLFGKGCNGFTMDGVTFIDQAYFYRSSAFKMTDISLENIVFLGTNADSAFRSSGSSASAGTLTNFFFRKCYFTKGAGSYIARFSDPATSGWEDCLFVNCNKGIYMWGSNGGPTAYVTLRGNVFKSCTAGTMFSGFSDTNAKFNSSLLIENNTLIDCTGGTFFAATKVISGANFIIRNNKFIGTSAGCISITPMAGSSGQSISMNENYFGSSIGVALKNNTDSVADAARNYFANGTPGTSVTGPSVYVPYYIDNAMTKLSGSFDIENVIAPAGAVVDKDAKTVTYNAAVASDSVKFNLSVSEGATYTFYKDAKCTEVIEGTELVLNGVETKAYIKVLAEDGVTGNTYTVTVNQPMNTKAELLGLDITGVVDLGVKNGVNRYNLPASYVAGPLLPKASAGATVNVYAAADTECKNPISYTDSIDFPVGTTEYIFKITSEDGKTENLYKVSLSRAKSDACELIGIDGGDIPAEIVGINATVEYNYDTTEVLPEAVVSGGATYEIFEDIGGNIRVNKAMPLEIGDNTCYILVTAEDGVSTAMYTVTMIRNDKSAENFVDISSFESFASPLDEESDEITYIGTRAISNFSKNEEYGMPYIYLTPYEFLPELTNELKVSYGATYDIYKNYDKDTGMVSGLVSNLNDPKKIKLNEGVNDFVIRITAANNSTNFYLLRVNNLVKNTENDIITVNEFVQQIGTNTYVNSTDKPQVDIFISDNATAKVYADRKKTKLVKSTMKTYVVGDTKEAFNDCLLDSAPEQSYVTYYIEITSQSGAKRDHVISLLTGSHSAEFTDVNAKHWAKSYIDDAYILGITSGAKQPDGTYKFNPSNSATREEVSIFMCNLMGVDAMAYSSVKLNYKDAKQISSWARNAVGAMTELGYMNGSNGNFNPKANITRQEFMTVMVRACALDTSKGTNAQIKGFKDAGKIASWAKNFVATAVAYKLVGGNNGYIKPNDNITRAEIVKIMVCGKDFARA